MSVDNRTKEQIDQAHQAGVGAGKQIVHDTIDLDDWVVLMALESCICLVLGYLVKLGRDELVLDKVVEGVKERMAKFRLGGIEPHGKA